MTILRQNCAVICTNFILAIADLSWKFADLRYAALPGLAHSQKICGFVITK
jgi:hypothetical protein